MTTQHAAVFLGVPTMMIAMLGHPDIERRDLSSLRAAVSGGSPVPARLHSVSTGSAHYVHAAR